MSDTKLRKNGGKGTFFGNLWRGVVKNNIPMGETIVAAIDGGNPIDVIKAISKDKDIPAKDKETDVGRFRTRCYRDARGY